MVVLRPKPPRVQHHHDFTLSMAPMPTSSVTVTTRATPDQTLAVLSDLGRFSAWLPRSSSYRGTRVAEADGPARPARVGDRYTDRTSLGEVRGAVTAIRPGRGISFHQATVDDALSIDIDYTLTPVAGGTQIRRTGAIRTSDRLRLVGPLVVWFTRRENARTMRHLATHLDSLSTSEEGHHG